MALFYVHSMNWRNSCIDTAISGVDKGVQPLFPPIMAGHNFFVKIDIYRGNENNYNCCHQISYFKDIVHQIRFWLGLYPRLCCILAGL